MTIYDELQPVAAELLKEFKQGTIQLIQLTPGTGPADNPGPATEVITDLDAVAKGVSFKYVKDGLALSTDLQVTSAIVAGIVPNGRDFITIDGARFKIVEILPVPAAGTRVVWKFIVRKGG